MQNIKLIFAEAKTRFFKSESFRIGSGTRRSTNTAATSATPPTTSELMMPGEVQPHSWPKENPSISEASPIAKSTAPTGSKRSVLRWRGSVSTRMPMMKTTAPIGTLTKKIQRQVRYWVIRPPMVGPALARREDTRNHRGIDGKDARSPDSLEETGDDQDGQRRRCSAEDGAKHEDDQPCLIDGLAPEHIGQASERQQARSNHDQIANDDPFDGSADAHAKGVRDSWESNVHNRRIQGRHKGTQCDDNEHDPFVRLFLRV